MRALTVVALREPDVARLLTVDNVVTTRSQVAMVETVQHVGSVDHSRCSNLAHLAS